MLHILLGKKHNQVKIAKSMCGKADIKSEEETKNNTGEEALTR